MGRISTAEECKAAIAEVFAEHLARANRSEYDVKVCVLAVGRAPDEFGTFPVTGSAQQYCAATVAKLEAFRDNYYDPDGEYTNGAGVIGSVVESIKTIKTRLQV